MKKLYTIVFGVLLAATACDNDLDQVPPNIASSESLTDFTGVLNAAYFYQHGAATPMAVMGDFRADNAKMFEEPYPAFDRYNNDLTIMEDQFFGPFYTALYKSIISANNVIANSSDAQLVGEAKFLRALSYFKLVQAFGDVRVILGTPNIEDIPTFDLTRQPASEIYGNIILPDLQEAIGSLDNAGLANGKATRIAAQALLGKVYVHLGDFGSAEAPLAAVTNGAADAGISLQENYGDIFNVDNELNSEIIFATRVSSSVVDEYGFTEFWDWYGGRDSKAPFPLDADLIAAFDANGEVTDTLRRAVVIDEELMVSPKYPQAGGADFDFIELRLADVLLLYAETLNENGAPAAQVLGLLDPIRARAGLTPLDPGTLTDQTAIREAVLNERRLELAFEGQRWFDLVRTGTVDAEMEQEINSNYHVFPVPVSEVLASGGTITQNPGY
ncbi:MAG: RagB/SusD family nutrient uptake outer membrane protein [Pricia sp.]